MFGILSSIVKYIFIVIIYFFIFGVIRLIYLDIKSIDARGRQAQHKSPYLKLINRREHLDFKIEETYILNGDVEIGRSNKSGIAIRDPYISGKHARITFKNGKYYLQDLGSTNGLIVNDRKVTGEAVCLKDGDKIHIGQVDFLFVNG